MRCWISFSLGSKTSSCKAYNGFLLTKVVSGGNNWTWTIPAGISSPSWFRSLMHRDQKNLKILSNSPFHVQSLLYVWFQMSLPLTKEISGIYAWLLVPCNSWEVTEDASCIGKICVGRDPAVIPSAVSMWTKPSKASWSLKLTYCIRSWSHSYLNKDDSCSASLIAHAMVWHWDWQTGGLNTYFGN